ncbi:hypothetical protein E3Q08_01452 [Wallemia mellicola]|nr:hypothetical protein E3Q08_01452 [Wallemia mellicola]
MQRCPLRASSSFRPSYLAQPKLLGYKEDVGIPLDKGIIRVKATQKRECSRGPGISVEDNLEDSRFHDIYHQC